MADYPIRLNKFVAHSGIASRRKAVELIEKGEITVNGEVVTVPYEFVNETDQVSYKGKEIKPQVKYEYYLLNKPRGVVSTVEDENDRKTVLDLIDEPIAGLHPVGRLDRQTTGLLLLTNDGELTYKLTHPSSEISKIYEIKTDRDISPEDMQSIRDGITLEDGFIKPDAINYIEGRTKNKAVIKLHSGRNRIIRRIFAHLGYEVKGLDRTHLAMLSKKGVPQGQYRSLKASEINILKHLI